MFKNKFMRVILVAGCALILIGTSLIGWMMSNRDGKSEITVQLSEGKTELVEFENLALVPGEQCEYTVKLKKTTWTNIS